MIVGGILSLQFFSQNHTKSYALNRETTSCENLGNQCQLEISDFDLWGDNLKVGLFYNNFENAEESFQTAKIDFWQADAIESFNCGEFRKLSDFKALSLKYKIPLEGNILQKSSLDDQAIPCGLPNALLLFRDKILSIRDSQIEYTIKSEGEGQFIVDSMESIKSNWIEDDGEYFRWVRFLSSQGQANFELGVVSGSLPRSFTVNLRKGFGDLGEVYPTFLVFYSTRQVDMLSVGILLIVIGVVTLLSVLKNVGNLRKMRKFQNR